MTVYMYVFGSLVMVIGVAAIIIPYLVNRQRAPMEGDMKPEFQMTRFDEKQRPVLVSLYNNFMVIACVGQDSIQYSQIERAGISGFWVHLTIAKDSIRSDYELYALEAEKLWSLIQDKIQSKGRARSL